MARSDTNQIIGIVLMVLGVLIAIGVLGFGGLIALAGAIAAIVLGILVLAGKSRGSTGYGVALIVVGALVLLAPRLFATVAVAINLVAGILVAYLGYRKFEGKW